MSGFSIYNDQELLHRIADGDQKSFDQLFSQYRDRLFYYLRKITKSNEIAEEIVLDVFLKMWTGRAILTEIDNFEAFLFRVARNKAIDFLRKVKKSRFRQMELWDHLQAMAGSDTADQQLLLEETSAALQEAVEQLSPRRKKVFQLSREEGLTYEQIGKKLHLSTHTVRNHLSASLHFIRRHLAEELSWIIFFSILIGTP